MNWYKKSQEQAYQTQPTDSIQNNPDINIPTLLKPKKKKYKKSQQEITIYRGEHTGNKGGNYFSTDKEFARQFTQRGLESEVIAKRIDLSLIYDARTEGKPLPNANNEKEFDEAMTRTKELSLCGFRLSEGENEPDSIYMLDDGKSILKNSNNQNKSLNITNELLICPFCKETDFDFIGLKYHLSSGLCDIYNSIDISNIKKPI